MLVGEEIPPSTTPTFFCGAKFLVHLTRKREDQRAWLHPAEPPFPFFDFSFPKRASWTLDVDFVTKPGLFCLNCASKTLRFAVQQKKRLFPSQLSEERGEQSPPSSQELEVFMEWSIKQQDGQRHEEDGERWLDEGGAMGKVMGKVDNHPSVQV